jgi:AraC-like DNA-binding protein
MKRVKSIKIHPKNYYDGLRKSCPIEINNLLLFRRASSNELAEEERANHHRFLLISCMKGVLRANVDYKNYLIQSNSAFLIFPFQFHLFSAANSNDIELFCITFEMEDQELLSGLKNQPVLLDDENKIWMDYIIEAYLLKQSDRAIKLVELFLRNLLDKTADRQLCVKSEKAGKNLTLLQRVNTFILKNRSEPYTLEDVSRHAGLSLSHFRKKFQEEYGITAGKYIRTSKMNSALSLLLNEGMSITATADLCGYDSSASFSTAFKNYYKYSPREYIKKCG